jgi:hypothetical protein
MANESNNALTVASNIGLTLLTCVFVVLKALGYLTWSWWLVFAPMWGPIALIAAIMLVGGLFVGVAAIIVGLAKRGTR